MYIITESKLILWFIDSLPWIFFTIHPSNDFLRLYPSIYHLIGHLSSDFIIIHLSLDFRGSTNLVIVWEPTHLVILSWSKYLHLPSDILYDWNIHNKINYLQLSQIISSATFASVKSPTEFLSDLGFKNDSEGFNFRISLFREPVKSW